MIAKALAALLTVGAMALSVPVQAEVRSAEREGFIVHLSQDVAAEPAAIFAAFTRPADWWDSQHSWSGDARNMAVDARAGGCWCETLRQNGGVEHGRIVSYDPAGGSIVFDSLLGPLLTMGQSGRLHWRVESGAGEGRSRIIWTYRVAVLPSGNPAQDAVLASAVDNVLHQQLMRLAAHVTGAPMPTP